MTGLIQGSLASAEKTLYDPIWRPLRQYHRESMAKLIKNLLRLTWLFCLHLEWWSLKWGLWNQTVHKPFKSTAAKTMSFVWVLNRAIKCASTINFALRIRNLTAIYWLTPLRVIICNCVVFISHIFCLIPCEICLETFKILIFFLKYFFTCLVWRKNIYTLLDYSVLTKILQGRDHVSSGFAKICT